MPGLEQCNKRRPDDGHHAVVGHRTSLKRVDLLELVSSERAAHNAQSYTHACIVIGRTTHGPHAMIALFGKTIERAYA